MERRDKVSLAREYRAQGLSLEEIGQELGLSVASVRTYLSRGAKSRPKESPEAIQTETKSEPPKESRTRGRKEPEKRYVLEMARLIKELCGARDACKQCRMSGYQNCVKVFLGGSPNELSPEFIVELFRHTYKD